MHVVVGAVLLEVRQGEPVAAVAVALQQLLGERLSLFLALPIRSRSEWEAQEARPTQRLEALVVLHPSVHYFPYREESGVLVLRQVEVGRLAEMVGGKGVTGIIHPTHQFQLVGREEVQYLGLEELRVLVIRLGPHLDNLGAAAEAVPVKPSPVVMGLMDSCGLYGDEHERMGCY